MPDHLDAMTRIAAFRRRTVFGEDKQRAMTGIYPLSVFREEGEKPPAPSLEALVRPESGEEPRRHRLQLSQMKFRGFGAMIRSIRAGA